MKVDSYLRRLWSVLFSSYLSLCGKIRAFRCTKSAFYFSHRINKYFTFCILHHLKGVNFYLSRHILSTSLCPVSFCTEKSRLFIYFRTFQSSSTHYTNNTTIQAIQAVQGYKQYKATSSTRLQAHTRYTSLI